MKTSFTLVVLWSLFTSLKALAVPQLSSLPSAQATIYLDFDGQYVTSTIWNGGKPIDCAPSGMNDAQITEIFNRVSEDYRPFNVNITTDSTKFLAAPLTNRIRMIVTTTSAWYQGVGGVAYVGSFTWGDDTPGFIFPDRLGPFKPKIVAECCSHESGHTLGLSHQSKYDGACAMTSVYNDGVGAGETGWAPIMGNSYYKNFTGWNNGPTPSGCAALQDNLTTITSNNGFTYRTDDYGNTADMNATAITIANKSFSTSGIISTTTDKDVFQIDIPQNGTMHLSALPYSVGANDDGADLDVKITLLNAQKQTINIYDDKNLLDITIDTTLLAGKYYIVLDGTGNTFTSDYGSLGSYTVTGTYAPLSITPIRDIALNGKVDNSNHDLNWNIVSDEPIKSLELESSNDGSHFKSLAVINSESKNYIYNPIISGDIFYRLKVTSVIDQTAYSNVIILKSLSKSEKIFTVSNVVHDEIEVNAPANYQYMIADINGRIIAHGSNNAGIKRISINNHPNGMYVMQIISENQRITERIIRQ
jgi:hypothetical protein